MIFPLGKAWKWLKSKENILFNFFLKYSCAQSVLAAICSLIVTECNVVQTAALVYLFEKVYDFREVPRRKLSAYGKSLNQCNTSVQ